MSLGARIREARISKGMTQHQLGGGIVTPSMISQIESDKAKPSYKVLEAIAERLETPLEVFLSDMDSQMERQTAYKASKGLIACKRYDQAAGLLEDLLQDQHPSIKQNELKLDLSECYLHLDRYDDAFEVLREVINSVEETGSPSVQLSALNKIGLVELKRKKQHRAIFYWSKAVELMDKFPNEDPFLCAQILMNLGRIHYQIGEFVEANDLYIRAADYLMNTNHLENIAQTYFGLGNTYQKMKNYEKAVEYNNYATVILETLENMKLATVLKKESAILMAEAGKYDTALELLDRCLKECQGGENREECASILGEMAKIYLCQQKFDLAIETADHALTYDTNQCVVSAPILRTRGRAQASINQHSRAIDSLQLAANLYKENVLLHDFADTMSMLADLYQAEGDLQKANECMLQMRHALQENLKSKGILLSSF